MSWIKWKAGLAGMAVAFSLAVDALAFTVTGSVSTYSYQPDYNAVGAKIPGRRVHIEVSWLGSTPYSNCEQGSIADDVFTDTSGTFTTTFDPPTISGPCIDGPHGQRYRIVANTPGSETNAITMGESLALKPSYTFNFINAPVELSPDGTFWARRVGTGAQPLFFIEGFDPGDSIKTPAMLDLFRGSLLGTGAGNVTKSFLDFSAGKSYSLWILANGPNWGKSMKGNEGLPIPASDGQLYQAMRFIKDIRNKYHAGKGMVIGGFSAGGLVAKAGLQKWCSGYWNASTGGVLDTGCAGVNLWWAADAPLRGAVIPAALQRYMCDGRLDPANCWKINNRAASELLSVWIDSGNNNYCNTNCNDLGGCNSKDGDFSNGTPCFANSGPRQAFVNWATTQMPQRNGVDIPAVTFAKGGAPTEWAQQPGCAIGDPFLVTAVKNCGDHRLFANTASGSGECGNGSVNTGIADLNGKTGSTPWPCPSYTLEVRWLPTFMPSTSALDLCENCSVASIPANYPYKDYWWNTSERNAPHLGTFPTGGTSMLAAWISEYSVGMKDRPVCSHPYKIKGFKNPTMNGCRMPSSDVCSKDGVDNDGDDLIDDGNGSGGDGYCDVDERARAYACNVNDCGGAACGILAACMSDIPPLER